MRARAAAVLVAAALAGCASLPGQGAAPGAPRGPSTIPSTAIDLGDWRRASASSVQRAFADTVANRYGAGLALTAVSGDLGRQHFRCAAPSDRRGDPPDQICSRTERQGDCAHTWQVLLYNDAGARGLSRSRGLYDRVCRSDDSGLLGGR